MKDHRILYNVFITLSLFFSLPAFSYDGQITDTLKSAVIYAKREFRNRTSGAGLKQLDSTLLNRGYAFLSNPDAIKIVQMLPGVMPGTELLSGLYVHGGDGNDNLFLLDGVPLLQVTHLGGLFSTFNTDIIKSIDFYKSGFPAKFGGRLSSVLDITTNEGDLNSYSGSFSIGLIDGRFSFQGPLIKNRMSFNIAMRRSWLDIITFPALKIYNSGKSNKTDFGYKFYDINANLLFKASARDDLRFNCHIGKDKLFYSESERDKIYGKEIYYAEKGDNIGTMWGNLATSFDWRHSFNDRIISNTRLFYTRGTSNGMSGSSGYSVSDEDSLSAYSEVDRILNTINITGVSNDFEFNFYKKRLNIGFLYLNSDYNPRSSKDLSNAGKISIFPSEQRYNTNEISSYVQGDFNIGGLSLTTGAMLAYYIAESADYFRFQPRIAANYQFEENMEISGSYSFMSQFSHLASSIYIDLPTNLWLPSTAMIKPSDSHHIAFDLLYRFSPKLTANLGGYFRTIDNCLMYYGTPSWFMSVDNWEKNMKRGKGLAYGAELELSYDTGRLQAKLYYTLSWSRRLFRDLYHEWFPDKFDNRHKITLATTYHINKRWELNASWNYHSGNRVTIPEHIVSGPDENEIIVFSKPYNAKMPDYHRLDVGVNYKRRIRDRYESIWNISIYNAYCRLNPFVMGFSKAEDGRLVANVKSLFPIIPSFGYTIRF